MNARTGGIFRTAVLGLFLALFACMFIADTVQAQAASKSSDNAAAWNQYNAQKQDPILPVLGEIALPCLGTALAGQTSRCKPSAFVRGGSLVTMVFFAGGGNASLATLSYLGYLGGTAWGAIEANKVVQESNLALRQSLGLASASVSITPSIEAGFEEGRYNVTFLSLKH